MDLIGDICLFSFLNPPHYFVCFSKLINNYLPTLTRHGDEASGANYTIYLEHLGGFLPILKGKKTSKLKPEFVIFDPLKGKKDNRKQ